MSQTYSIEREFKKIGNDESSKKFTTNYVCNYVDLKNTLLPLIKCDVLSCDNCFHHLCQN